MTREEAVKILNPETTAEALKEIEDYGGFHGKETKIAAVNAACRLAVDALREQIEREKQENGWINVKDKLPAEYTRVLAACEDGVVRINRVEYDAFPCIVNRHSKFVRTTHWMPLPEPPDNPELLEGDGKK